MKRFLYWFAWLQLGMPFLVATVSLGALAESLKEGLRYGLLGVIYLAPFLAINATVLSLLLTKTKTAKVKSVVLGSDCLLAFVFVFHGRLMPGNTDRDFNGDAGLALAAITWFATGTLVSALALKCEPKKP